MSPPGGGARSEERCPGKTKSGRPCRAAVLPGSRFCLSHDPSRRAALAESRRRGGRTMAARLAAKVLPAGSPNPALDGSRDVVVYVSATIGRVERGEVDPRVGNCIAVLLACLQRALNQVEVLERIGKIEAAVAALPTAEAAGIADDLAAVRAASEARQ